MLKRYDIWALDYHELAVEEDEDGDRVKWEDVEKALAEYNTPSHREVKRKDRAYNHMFEELRD